MKSLQLDPKSLAIGLLLGACVFLLMAAQDQRAGDTSPAFSIATSNENTYVIDSRTGETWRLSAQFPSVNGNPITFYWSPAGRPGKP
jgi:hypothetical protein